MLFLDVIRTGMDDFACVYIVADSPESAHAIAKQHGKSSGAVPTQTNPSLTDQLREDKGLGWSSIVVGADGFVDITGLQNYV